MGLSPQGQGLWMVLSWPDHSCLHLLLGFLKHRCTPHPVPQKPSCCPLVSTVSPAWRRILQMQISSGYKLTLAEKALGEGSEELCSTPASLLSLTAPACLLRVKSSSYEYLPPPCLGVGLK